MSRHRYVLVVVLVLLAIGVSGVVVRVTRDPSLGPPLMIAPALQSEPVAEPGTPPPVAQAAPPSLAKSPVASRSPSARPSRSPSPSPSVTPSRTPTVKPTKTTAAPAASIAARYSVRRGRGDSLRGAAVVSNTGAAAGSWTLVLTFDSRVTITRASGNAEISGSLVMVRGGSLAAGQSDLVRFSGRTNSRDTPIRPVACTINGHSCG